MWAEARKQEKRLRGLMVDHKRRAERRRDFYEKTKLDPNQFLQIHGQSAKLHFDQSLSASASNGVMMPWQGQKDNLIDRFDGRAHLDIIPESSSMSHSHSTKEEDSCSSSKEGRLINYERYRILIQNDFLKIPEEKFLQTISYEEKYGSSLATKAKEDKKKSEKNKSAIGYVYEDTEMTIPPTSSATNDQGDHCKSYSDEDSDCDLDLTVDVSALDNEARLCLNKLGKNYSLSKEEFVSLLLQDIEEARIANLEKQREEDKALFSQKKTRRERRLLKSKSLVYPRPSTPSYSTSKDSKDRKGAEGGNSSSSGRSRSNSPEHPGKIEFITCFGAESEDELTEEAAIDPIPLRVVVIIHHLLDHMIPSGKSHHEVTRLLPVQVMTTAKVQDTAQSIAQGGIPVVPLRKRKTLSHFPRLCPHPSSDIIGLH